MKMKKLIITASLLVAGAAMMATSALAQSISDGDLLINFRLNNGGAGSYDMEVDLGAATNFTGTNSLVELGKLNSDLTSVYGASWNSNANLVYSVVGASTATGNMWISNPGNANTVTAISPLPSGANSGQIAQLENEVSGTSLGGSAYKVTVAAGDPFNYSDVIRDVDSNQGGPPGPFSSDYGFMPFSTEQGVSSGLTTESLYDQNPGSGRFPVETSTYDGIFELAGNGDLYYVGIESVPEPSTYVLMVLVLGAMAVMVVRQRRAALNSESTI